MTSAIDLKEIRQRVLTTYYQDGLFELTLGLSLALTGCLLLVSDMFGMLWYFPWLLMTISLPAAKKRYVASRVGYVALSSRKGKVKLVVKLSLVGVMMLLLGILVFFLATTHRMPSWLSSTLGALFEFEWWAAVVGVLLAIVFGFAAARSGITRFYVFALLLGIGSVVVSLLNMSPGMRATSLFVSMGVVVMISGLVMFIRFLREYPVLEEDRADDRD